MDDTLKGSSSSRSHQICLCNHFLSPVSFLLLFKIKIFRKFTILPIAVIFTKEKGQKCVSTLCFFFVKNKFTYFSFRRCILTHAANSRFSRFMGGTIYASQWEHVRRWFARTFVHIERVLLHKSTGQQLVNFLLKRNPNSLSPTFMTRIY